MPVNHGQGHSKRWYQQCFIPISSDSSDDSDTESVIMPHTSTPTSTTREEEFSSPPSPLSFPPPPPPPPLLPPPPPPQLSFQLPPPPLPSTDSIWDQLFPQSLVTPSPSPPPSPLQLFSLPPSPTFTTPPLPTSTTREEYFPSSSLSPPPPPQPLFPPRPCINTPQPFIRMVKISDLHEKDKVSNCPICMEEFKDYDQASKLPCNHTYCHECILLWINNNKTCPVCRLQLDDWELGDTSLDQQPQNPVAVRENHVQSPWNYFHLVLGSQDLENSESGNSDEGDFDSACEELGDSNANGDIVGTSQSPHA